jgi:hypothetical protein
MKGKDRSLRQAVSIVIILAIALAMPVAQAHATLQVKRRMQGTLLWSCDFESGSHNPAPYTSYCFSTPNDQAIAPGNNPGEVVTSLVHSGKYAGYYYITSNPTAGWVRDYWNMYWNTQPTTHDLLAVAWVYVPTQTMTGPVSFITIGFDGYTPITVDIDRQTLPHMYLKLWNSIFTDADAYQLNPKVEFPFDKWVKLALEIHYRPAAEASNLILYQDDVKIIDFQTHALAAQPKNLLAIHFGLYVGNGQGAFKVYNDDLSLYDIS